MVFYTRKVSIKINVIFPFINTFCNLRSVGDICDKIFIAFFYRQPLYSTFVFNIISNLIFVTAKIIIMKKKHPSIIKPQMCFQLYSSIACLINTRITKSNGTIIYDKWIIVRY